MARVGPVVPSLPVTIVASGATAVRVAAAFEDPETSWRLVHQLARRLDEAAIPGVTCVIPTYDAALVELRPDTADLAALTRALEIMIDGIDFGEPLTRHPRHFEVPVLYDFDDELDLRGVADAQGLSREEVARLHAEPDYVVRCLGAPGGSPMLDGPPLPDPVPRLRSPRAHVPQGMVSVAGRQATITPAAAPGGWPLIGRTPLAVLDLSSDGPLVPYAPGDVLRFRPIDRAEFDALRGSRLAAR
nr:carboxyltransferase domain-containing protein [Microbacterium sp. ZXX196]